MKRKRCKTCGELFKPKRSKIRFCSRKCSNVVNREKIENLNRTLPERFWNKVNFCGPSPDPRYAEGQCWIWIGHKDKAGYGQLGHSFKKLTGFARAHRYSYFLMNGKDPGELMVCHRCDNPSCVRHLFLGTAKDNNLDMIEKGRYRHSKWRK